MTAAILVIGDEILIGQVADTNSSSISLCINKLGIRVIQMRSVGDDAQSINSALQDLLQLVDIVIITGGLGPTKDDKTKAILAAYFGAKSMVMHAPTLQHVSKIAQKSGFEMNDLNRAQALVPDVCQVLYNTLGTAPGMWFEQDGKVAISLPGVPFEMEHILHNEVVPRLQQRFATPNIVHSTALVFGIAESMLSKQIETWEDALPAQWHLAYLPTPLGIKLRLSNYDATDKNTAAQEAQQQFAVLQNIIPAYFVGCGDGTLERFVAQDLRNKHYTVATAESCTGGQIATLLTSISGSSTYFKGSVVAYDNAVKTQVLGVDEKNISQYGAVSEEVVIQMAQGVQRIMHTDFAVATSGVAGPTGGTPDKPVGTVWIAVASPTSVTASLFHFGNRQRSHVVARASATALNLLRQALETTFSPH